jgi:Mycobacterial 4 TMS phage holin, superfamily IV
MKQFRVFRHPVRGFEAVKVGVSWPAGFFSVFWMLTRASETRGGVRFLTCQTPDRFWFFAYEWSSPPRLLDALLTFPLTLMTFGLFLFVINALMLRFATLFVSGFVVQGFLPALLGAVVLALVHLALRALVAD